MQVKYKKKKGFVKVRLKILYLTIQTEITYSIHKQ